MASAPNDEQTSKAVSPPEQTKPRTLSVSRIAASRRRRSPEFCAAASKEIIRWQPSATGCTLPADAADKARQSPQRGAGIERLARLLGLPCGVSGQIGLTGVSERV